MKSSSLSLSEKKVLIVASLFPPDNLGGAEISAFNLACWMRANGINVGVLTTAKTPDDACDDVEVDGLRVWRVWMPRPYPMYHFSKAKWWQKPLWHLQDHLDPRNRTIAARVLDDFQPDFVNIHLLQGLGHNVVSEIAKRNLPTVYFLHDLSLACIRTSMFKGGKECKSHCLPCKLSANYKAHYISQIRHLAYCSPSRANIEKLDQYFPIKNRPCSAIMNANSYPAATISRTKTDHLRIVYVGRLAGPKGIDVLLRAARALAESHSISVTIVGSGPDEASLRTTYGSLPWCRFTGFIGQQEISNIMSQSDVLCIPSIWPENSPGVVIHALRLGLPVVGSDIGGIPELVEHEKNGVLVRAADVDALRGALEKIADNPARLDEWREYALANAGKFDQDYLAARVLAYMDNLFGSARDDTQSNYR